MAGKTAILTVKILGDAKEAQKALDDTAGSAGKFESGVKSAAVPAAAALAAVGAAGLSAAKAAAEDAAAADQLALALRNATGASDKSIANTEAWISKTSKAAAVADDELRPALSTLVRATGDVGTSQDALSTALDVSAATGKDVGSVSDALAKAYAGQTTSLGKLVPGMDKAILASGDMDAIMAELARTTGGAAAEAAGSAEGQVKGMEIAMAEAQETIGGALLPALTGIAKVLATVADWVGKNSTLFLVLGGVIGGIAAVILGLNVAFKAYAIITKGVAAATKIWAIAQRILNSAFLTSPITWIVIGIIALVAAIVLIATKTTWFQDIWAAVWGFITNVASAAWEAIKSAAAAALAWLVSIWEGLKAAVSAVWEWIRTAIDAVLSVVVGIVRGYIAIYVAIWDGIKAGVQAVWSWIQTAIDVALAVIKGIISRYIAIYVGIWEGIKAAVGAVWDWLKDAARTALDAILDPINAVKRAFDRVVDSIKSVIEWIKNIKVPAAVQSAIDAIGGILPFSAAPPPASSSGTALAAGSSAVRGLRAAPGLSSSASSGGGITVVVQGALDPVAVARQIRQILTADDRRRSGVVIA